MENPKNSQQPHIVYSDDDIIVLDKPSGLVCNRAASVRGATIQGWVEDNYPLAVSFQDKGLIVNGYPVGEEFTSRAGLVHRLDKETSGLLVVTRNVPAFASLKQQFMEHAVAKEYTALVYGSVTSFLSKKKPEQSQKQFTIDAPIARNPKNPTKWAVVEGGREAATEFEVLTEYVGKPGKQGRMTYTLLKILPKSGRTHQIRVHLAALGFPVVGDTQYGGRRRARYERELLGRHFLHAGNLEFIHPREGRMLAFSSPLPSDLTSFLSTFCS